MKTLLLLALCLLAVAHEHEHHRETYSKWEEFLRKHDYSQQGNEPYWKNYHNWNQWVNQKGASVSSLPSKEGLDSWRKWNLDQEANNKDWRSINAQETAREGYKEEQDEQWKQWALNRFAPGAPTNLANTRVEKDYPSNSRGSNKDKDGDQTAGWEGMVPTAYQGLSKNKRLTPEEEKARQNGAVDWRTYVPKDPEDDTPYSDKYYQSKYYNRNKGSNWRNDWVDYLPGSAKKEDPDYKEWKKYAVEHGTDNDKYYKYADKYWNGPKGGEDYEKYFDWKKYAGNYGGGWGPSSLLAKPPRSKNEDDTQDSGKSSSKNSGREGSNSGNNGNDWNSSIPEDYRHFIPNNTYASGGGYGGGKKNNSNGNSNVDWIQYVPPEYRHFIPPSATDPNSPNNQYGNEGERGKGQEERGKGHEREEERESARGPSRGPPRSKSEYEKREREEEPKRRHERAAKRSSKDDNESRSKKDDDDGGKKGHRKGPHEDQDFADAQSLAAFSTSVPSGAQSTKWSGIVLSLVVLTCLVVVVASGYMIKKLKKRHCDYQPVEELDIDRLLFV